MKQLQDFFIKLGRLVYSDKAGLIISGMVLSRGVSDLQADPYLGAFGLALAGLLVLVCWSGVSRKAEQPEVHP